MFETIVAVVALPGHYLLSVPEHRFYWLYLASAALIAVLVRARRAGLVAAAAQVFDRAVWLHRSAIVDYQLVTLNYLVSIAELGLGVLGSEAVAHGGSAGLAALFGPSPAWSGGWGAQAALTVAMILASDFANFYFHWLQHRAPVLWELHKVHHSAEVLTPLTALRVHPLAALLGSQFIALCVGAVAAIFAYLFRDPVTELTILGVNALAFGWLTILGGHLQHSHVWIMYPRALRLIFNSPALHLIHHSADARHRNKNLGFTFSFWDRLAGTLHEPREDERNLTLGVAPRDMAELRTPAQLYWTPLRNIGRLARRWSMRCGALSRGMMKALGLRIYVSTDRGG